MVKRTAFLLEWAYGARIMSKEDEAMPIVLEKARLNMWNMIGFAVGIAVTAFGWGVTYNSVNTGISEAKAEVTRIKLDNDAKFLSIETKVAPIAGLQFQAARALEQVAETKQSVDEANKRIDRVVDSFNNKLDTAISAVNSMNVELKVLGNEVRKGNK